MSNSSLSIRRGDIYWIDWSPGRNSEQTGVRPGVVVQRDAANRNPGYSNVIVVAVSRQGRPIPFHIGLQPTADNGLSAVSYVKCEQIQTVSKARLTQFIGKISDDDLQAVDEVVLDLDGL